jgi:hypothetical protein
MHTPDVDLLVSWHASRQAGNLDFAPMMPADAHEAVGEVVSVPILIPRTRLRCPIGPDASTTKIGISEGIVGHSSPAPA